MTSGWIGVFALFRCSTKETIPPSYRNTWDFWSRSSSMVICSPRLRKASSRRRCERTSKLKEVVSKISGSGLKVIFVPRWLVIAVSSPGVVRRAAVVAMNFPLPAATHLHLERLRERVHDRHANAVETTRDLVRALVELPARMQLGHHDLRCRHTLGRVQLDRDPSTIIV